jgi:hypothetical protein
MTVERPHAVQTRAIRVRGRGNADVDILVGSTAEVDLGRVSCTQFRSHRKGNSSEGLYIISIRWNIDIFKRDGFILRGPKTFPKTDLLQPPTINPLAIITPGESSGLSYLRQRNILGDSTFTKLVDGLEETDKFRALKTSSVADLGRHVNRVLEVFLLVVSVGVFLVLVTWLGRHSSCGRSEGRCR